MNMGALQYETGKPDEAIASERRALAIFQKLADENPAVTECQRSLAMTHGNIGMLQKETDKNSESLESYRRALAIFQKLVDDNPAATEFQSDLANIHNESGDLLRLNGKPREARASYEAGLAIIEGLIKTQHALPSSPVHFARLVQGLKGLGATQQADGQPADAVASWKRAIASDERIRSSRGQTLYYLAGCHARLGGIAGTAGSGLSAAEGAAERDRAMVVLRRAVAAGYRKAYLMKHDPDLDPLRGRPDFQLLMLDLAMPTYPFAGGG